MKNEERKRFERWARRADIYHPINRDSKIDIRRAYEAGVRAGRDMERLKNEE